jgi:16S rRNA (guanine527-N7)-methyltransferase
MDTSTIAEKLMPFVSRPLSPAQLNKISMYIDILLQWNRQISLTAIRDPGEIVTRHFGESLFAAQQLFPQLAGETVGPDSASVSVVDVGSGAGFPGLPMKIWETDILLTLIESNKKKAVFLREVGRTLSLSHVEVFDGRAEDYQKRADVVTLRGVERFESVLSVAGRLIVPGGRVALLIGAKQVGSAKAVLPNFEWDREIPIPHSESRVIQLGKQR